MIGFIAWLGFGFTVIGSAMLSFKLWQGWLAFILANAFWALFALTQGQVQLLLQMTVLMIPCIVGIVNREK